MNWIALTNALQLSELVERSNAKPQLIFKHSTRCSISSMAKNRLDKSVPPADVDCHYLDLISYRSISNQIAQDFSVVHESPQVLLIVKGKCIYDESHSGISIDEIAEVLEKANHANLS
jgi:bacillithiol system protein YtxJ